MKVAICVPHYGDVTAEFCFSLAKLIDYTARLRINFNGADTDIEIELFMRSSSVLPQLRNILVRDAANWGANFLLWIDADQSFPNEALLRLLSLNLPVVGVNYPRRVAPHRPTAAREGELVWTTEAIASQGTVEQVDSIGFGLCLFDMNVIDGLEWPLFATEMIGDGTRIVGEDVYFFRRLKEAGVPVHLDHALSWSIGHIAQHVLMNADAGS